MKKTKDAKGMSLVLFVIIIVTVIILGWVIVSIILKNNPTTTQKEFAEWTQDRTTVTREDVILEVGDRVRLKIEDKEESSQYSANGYTGRWAVLGVENGKLLLVSTTEVETEIDLYGKEGKTTGVPIDAGYNNGIDKLNNISSKYLNKEYADEARSIKIEDLIRVIGYEPVKGENDSVDYSYNVNYEHFTNTKAYNLLFKDANYWCATKYSQVHENYVEYGYPIVYGDFDIFNYDLYTSNGTENLRPSGVRAVIRLRLDVQVEKIS